MGFLDAGPDTREEFLVVSTVRGRLTVDLPGTGLQQHAKARVFLLENRTCVVVLPDGQSNRGLVWASYAVQKSYWHAAAELLTVKFGDNDGGLVVDGSGCGCGMGAVGNAGPIDGDYRLTPVRSPDWHSSV